jgi:hypothetical protein
VPAHDTLDVPEDRAGPPVGLIQGYVARSMNSVRANCPTKALLGGSPDDCDATRTAFAQTRKRRVPRTWRGTRAVVRGIGRTGGLVDERRPDPVPAFTSLASGPGTDLKVLATGLAVGVLLDATVIRALLVPAVVSLFGRWNWWLPRLPARLLRVEPSRRSAR